MNNNLFSNNNNNNRLLFNNQGQGGGGAAPMFNNQGTPAPNPGANFMNQNQQQQQQQQNFMNTPSFNNQNTQNPMFNNNNMMNNNNTSTFNNNNMFNAGNNNNQNAGNNNMGFNNMQGYNNQNPNNYNYSVLFKPQYPESLRDFKKRIEQVQMHLEECSRRMANRNIQSLSLNQYNNLIDKPLRQLQFKNQVIEITTYFHELKAKLNSLKNTNQEIQDKMKNFSQETHKKLEVYKKCLLQTVSHERLIKQVTSQLEMMNKQVQDYFSPLMNALKNKNKIPIKEPNQFDLKVSYDILNKLEILNQRIDDIVACENQPSEQQLYNTTTVFQQLIQYYQNVSCSFYQFCTKYKILKQKAIAEKRLNFKQTMSKVVTKVQENLQSQFKYYNLIKSINQLLDTKEKRKKKQFQAQYDSFIKRRY